jgi:hypothetical protein
MWSFSKLDSFLSWRSKRWYCIVQNIAHNIREWKILMIEYWPLRSKPIYSELLGFWTLSIIWCSRKYRMIGKVQNPSNSECYTSSSEPFRIYAYIPAEFCLALYFYWFLVCLSQSWRWRQYIPLNGRRTSAGLHGVTSYNVVLFIVTTMRAWNSSKMYIML